MSLNHFSKFVCVVLLLIFASKTNSQRIKFIESDDYKRRLLPRQESFDCNCIRMPTRLCFRLRNRRDWRAARKNCERITTTRVPIIRDPFPPTPTSNEDCGRSKKDDYYGSFIMVGGGNNATEGSWPWMAAVRMRERSGYTPWCSGFLIDRRHLISAAHCYDTRDPDLYRARIGNTNQNEADEYSITRIVVHEGYTVGLFYDDVAVLTLDRDVDFPNFNPICLPDQEVNRMSFIGRGTTVVGWGTERPRGEYKIYLQELNRLPVVSNQQCQRALRAALGGVFQRQFPRGIIRDIICAGFQEGGKDACGGDSGGPLMLKSRNRWYAIGIVSFGYSCGLPGVPGGYTKVSNYLDWIRQNIKD